MPRSSGISGSSNIWELNSAFDQMEANLVVEQKAANSQPAASITPPAQDSSLKSNGKGLNKLEKGALRIAERKGAPTTAERIQNLNDELSRLLNLKAILELTIDRAYKVCSPAPTSESYCTETDIKRFESLLAIMDGRIELINAELAQLSKEQNSSSNKM